MARRHTISDNTKKKIATLANEATAYGQAGRALKEDPHNYDTLQALKGLEQDNSLASETPTVLRGRAADGVRSRQSSLVELLDRDGTLDAVVKDIVNTVPAAGTPDKQLAYVTQLMSIVPYAEPKSGIGEPFKGYRELSRAIQQQDIPTILKVLQKDQKERARLLEDIAAVNPQAILTEGMKRAGAKLEEASRYIGKTDKQGNLTGINTDIVKEYLLEGLGKASAEERGAVYTALLGTASKQLKSVGYK